MGNTHKNLANIGHVHMYVVTEIMMARRQTERQTDRKCSTTTTPYRGGGELSNDKTHGRIQD